MSNSVDGSADDAIGTARTRIPENPVPALVTDGACIIGTLHNLEVGVDTNKPLPREVIERTRRQAEKFLSRTLAAYNRDVARGEVGAGGSGRASVDSAITPSCPTGLLYGRVQSGKTLAMIAFSALAIDNGFRVVIVFTSNFVKLVEQTEQRFRALEGPLIRASTSRDQWAGDREHIRDHIADHGLVVVCAKDQNHIEGLVDFLGQTGASGYPCLILDDEADQATPDTHVRARASGKEVDPSKIHDQIVTAEDSARRTLRHHVFVQVTATPFPLVLQSTRSPLRPTFTQLLEPGDGYTGGECFFSADHVSATGGTPPLVFVAEEESDEIDAGPARAPTGLEKSIAFFLVSAAVQEIRDPGAAARGRNFLCHTSPRKGEHEKLDSLIKGFLQGVSADIQLEPVGPESESRLAWAYEELGRTLSDLPSFEEVVTRIGKLLPRRIVYVVNSAASRAEFGRNLNFIIGGNILGRGLTIENLLVTYYIRRPKISQMDTMLQHARMFGYRSSIMPYTRVFLPESLAIRFNQIHESERDLRALFEECEDPDRIPVAVAGSLRATRSGVLDPGSIGVVRAGEHLFPVFPVYKRKHLGNSYAQIGKLLRRLCGSDPQHSRAIELPIDGLIELANAVPISDEDATRWDRKALAVILDSLRARSQDQGFLMVRHMERTKNTLPTGALSGSELKSARSRSGPTFFLFEEDGNHPCWDDAPFWYPTLVFPESMPNQVYDRSE